MNWIFELTREVEKFLEHNRVSREEVFQLIRSVLAKFRGEDVNIDVKKLKGKWLGFHRIRRGDLRVIASFDFDKSRVYVEVIDWRGSVYK
ncbi:MAG: hypothetical protein A3C46_00575 [Deltaproteobacteria bacterium RIFCSPHIGHO2_02_FULL_44_16]|nr:MAG: hypothetical protein A3C46_00575 [Deltaproteobacteria bacterium RIFCSPHIGHO2_02_FULL_44_16]